MRATFLAIAFTLLTIVSRADDLLWGPIDLARWKDTPCLVGRLATEDDVKGGRATFYVTGDPTMKPLDIELPRCAIWNDTEKKKAVPVIVIQAVQTSKMTVVGFRFLSGGNGACLLSELELLKGPDDRFKELPNQRPDGTSAKAPPSNLSQGAAVPHP